MTSAPVTTSDIDPAVVTAAQGGCEQAHAAVYAHYADRLFTLIYRLVARRASAEDLLQEVFIEVLRNIHMYSGSGSFGGWLKSIAVNKSLSHLRSPWQRSRLWLTDHGFDDHPDPQAALDSRIGDERDAERALRALGPTTRAVVWLHDVEGYTHVEIGRLLGRTASFSKSQLARAHQRLREFLQVEPTNAASSTRTEPPSEDALTTGKFPCTSAPPSLSINS